MTPVRISLIPAKQSVVKIVTSEHFTFLEARPITAADTLFTLIDFYQHKEKKCKVVKGDVYQSLS